MEKWGGRFCENWRFSMKNIVCQFGLLLYKFTWKLPALHARPLSSHRKIGGTISLKLPIFEEEHLVWLVILYIEYFALPAWPLSPHIKLGGHGLAKLTDFQRRRFGLVGLFIWTFSTLRARPLSIDGKMGWTIWRKLAISRRSLALEVASLFSVPSSFL